MNQIVKFWLILLIITLGASRNNIFAEGTKQLAPDSSDRLYLALCMEEYGNFGRYEGTSEQRLFIHVEDPINEQIFLGFSQFVSSGHYPSLGGIVDAYVRIKDANGRIVWPDLDDVNGKSIGTGNIESYNQVVNGPNQIITNDGYDAWVFDPAPYGAGDYYIEFSRVQGEFSLDDLFTEWWDITVATKNANPTAINGRVWSKNWALQSPGYTGVVNGSSQFDSFARAFNGKVYSYCTEPNYPGGYVTEVDFKNSGFRGAAFNLAFNATGTDNTNDFTLNRKSIVNINKLSPEFPIFLNEPDIISYPSADSYGGFIADENYPKLFGCPGNYFFRVSVTKKGRIELLLDFDGVANKYDPDTRDRIITTLFHPHEHETGIIIRDIPWDGKDGKGNVVGTASVTAIFDYCQGTFHFPMYDVEFLETGIVPRTVRPVTPSPYTARLYWDDSNIPLELPQNPKEQRRVELTGSAAPNHYWDYYNYSSDYGYGNRNSINTYWNSYQTGTINTFTFELPAHGCDLFVPGSISGTVYNDANRNGSLDDGEVPLNGANVYLYHDVNNNKFLDDADELVETFVTKTPGTIEFPVGSGDFLRPGTGNFLFKPEQGKEYLVGVSNGTDIVTTSNYRYYTMYSLAVEHFDQYFGLTPAPEVSFSVDKLSLEEDNKISTLTANLSYEPIVPVRIEMEYDGTASTNDYLINRGTNAPEDNVFDMAVGETTGSIQYNSVSDQVDEDDESLIIRIASMVNCVENGDQDKTITIIDDDTAGVSASKSSLITSETGTEDKFTLVLDSKPTGDVSVSLRSTNLLEGIVNPQIVAFTPENWHIPMELVVTGQDDPIDDGDINFVIELFNVVSTDPFYDEMDPADVDVTNLDNDVAQLVISKSDVQVSEEGPSLDSFTVKLATKPTQEVIISISSSDESEGIVSIASISFTPSNWDSPQAIVIAGVDDDIDDGNQDFSIVLNSSSLDGNYDLLEDSVVAAINNDDNDTADFIVSAVSGNTHEDGSTATFTVKLQSQPLYDVQIAISSSDIGEGTVAPANLTFTPEEWDDLKVITLTGVNDLIEDGSQAYTITLNPASADVKYNSLGNKTVELLNEDDLDKASIVVSSITGNTKENGAQASFTLKLNSEPISDVSFSIVSNNEGEGIASPAVYTFTSENWMTDRTITVTGSNDDIDDGDQDYKIILTPSGSDAKYASLAPIEVDVVNEDDDTAAYIVSESNVETNESGTSASFTVVLQSQPTSNVTINLISGDPSEGLLDIETLTFTSENWASPKTVVVTGVNDDVDDDDQNYLINLSCTSSDATYNAQSNKSVSVTNIDDDQVDLIITETSNVTTEAGGTAEFTIHLQSEPTHSVTVNLSSNNEAEGTVSPVSYTFTTANWNSKKTIVVSGVDDDIDDNDQAYKVIATIVSSDIKYNALSEKQVLLINTDDDTAAFIISNNVGNTSESGNSHTFTVKLQSKPTQTVTFELTSSDTGEGLVSPLSLSFNPDDWTKTETVTISGVNDEIDDGNQIYTVTIDPTSLDSKYNVLENKELSLTNEDDDTASFSLTAISGNTHENGRAASFSISLESQPTQEVTVSLSSTNTLEGTVSPAAIVFNSSNWAESKTITVYGVDDKVQDGNQVYKINVHLESDDNNYKDLADKLVDVINEDDDQVGLLISSISRNTTEAGLNAEFTVKLKSQPTHDVSIALTTSDNTEGSISTTPIIFTSSNWNELRTIVVTGVNDDVNDGDKNYQALLNTSSADVLYNALPEATVDVINEDDDLAAYQVSAISTNTTEAGGTVTFSIVLESEPTADVSFSIGSSDESEGKVAPTSVIFTAANWDQAKDVVITGQNDDVADDNQTYTISLTPSSTDEKYNVLSKTEFSVLNEDDDSVDYIVSVIDGLTSEDGTSASFTVVLNSEPTHDVTIAMGSSDLGEGSLAVDHLLFTSATWDEPQTVIVSGVNDDVDDDDQNYKINLTTSSSDSKYDFLTGKEVLLINNDDDIVGYKVNEISSITTELGGKATFSVVLNSEPIENVTISLLSTDETEGTLSVSNLVFNSANWKDSQEVTVTGVNDNIADGNQAYKIQLSPASSDGKYNVLPSQEISLTNQDDDSFGLIVSAISGTTDETGKKATFTLKLNSEPTHDVVVSLLTDDASEGLASPNELTFNAMNWNSEQTVTVTGVNDDVDDDDQNYFIILDPSSADSNYSGLSNQQVAVTNVDDDLAALILTAISNHVDELGATATFTVRLQTKPVAGVTIDLESLDLGEGTVNPSTLSFDASDWSAPKTVTVTGVNDDVDDDDQAFDINLDLSGSIDSKYKDLSDYSMEVVNVDDDGAGITVSPISVSTTEAGGSATFTIVLLSQPTAEVSIALSSDNESEGKIDLSDVVFNDGNWNSPVTITVTGQNDQVDDGDQEFHILTGAASSADPDYNTKNPEDVRVVNMDDDKADFILSESNLSVDEVGINTKNFTVKLASEPVLGVTISLNSNNLSEGILDNNSLTFDSENWNAEQTVRLTSVDEKVQDGDQNYKIFVNSTSSADLVYKTLSTKEIDATTVDNDHAIENLIDENVVDNIISENVGVGADTYIKAKATDQDSDAITYSLTDNADGRFTIDGSSGVVKVLDADKIDFEKATSHQIEITASSIDGSSIKALFTIQITDVDATEGDTDHPIVSLVDADLTNNIISENAEVDAIVHITAEAYDADMDVITYSLAPNFQDWFKIDPESGIVRVSGNIDYESTFLIEHKAKITVLATSTDGSTFDAEFEITITDVDAVNGDTDHAIRDLGDDDDDANELSENATVNTIVHITALAFDDDDDIIRYSLDDSAEGRFQIDENSGIVSVLDADAIDFETKETHNIDVRATSSDDSFVVKAFTISILDVNPTDGDTDHDIANLHDTDTDENQISENAIVDDYVHIKAKATDEDGDIITYSLDNDADGRFKIASDGSISVLDPDKIDYETASSHNVVVRASSTDGTSLVKTFTIQITDVDGAGGDTDNRVENLVDVDAVANLISENAKNGDVVHIQAYAEDADKDVISYTIADPDGRFDINSSTGVVVVLDEDLIDFETAEFHEIWIVATSTDGSFVKEKFIVSIEDVLPSEGDTDNDISNLTDSDDDANRISENIKANEKVHITAYAKDADLDNIAYSLDDNAEGRFQIGIDDGVVTVLNANLIDYEQNTSHKIIARASSTDGSFSTAEFTIFVDDENASSGDTDNEIKGLKDIDLNENNISENAVKDDLVHIHAEATDLDNDVISYSLDDDADGRFKIHAGTGVVSVEDASKIDYEKAISHHIIVRATSSDLSTMTVTFTVNVIDVNGSNGDTDNLIEDLRDVDGLDNQISENALKGDLVHITAKATDEDKDGISYKLTNSADGRFQIDAVTGVVTVLDDSKIDYEKADSHDITVEALSTDGSTIEKIFTILISNMDSNSGDTDSSIADLKDVDPLDNTVSENAKLNDPVNIKAQAKDADDDLISYSLDEDSDGRFQIDSNTGVVTVFDASKINYEIKDFHDIVVRATSTDGSYITKGFTISIGDVDANTGDTDNDIANLHDADGLGNIISENAVSGDLAFITAKASDADGDKISYSLTFDADGRFRIDAITGVVSVDDDTDIDYEKAISHTITVKALSSDETSIERDFTILVDDVDANGGDKDNKIENLRDSDLADNIISENAKSNDSVHIKALADDLDGDVITYSLVNNAGGRFKIEPSSGVVQVENALLIDFEQWTSHTILVKASSTDGTEVTASFDITISNVDENEGDTDNRISEISDIDLNDNRISENAISGEDVHITAHASDDDDDVITYSLIDDANGRFQIDPDSGIVKVANASLIDYEESPSHQIEVQALSSDKTHSTAYFTIQITNVRHEEGDTDHEISEIIDVDNADNSISENASNEQLVGITAQATDEDRDYISYSLIDNAGGRFEIDATSGVVRVANDNLLDYEQWKQHSITVKAVSTDGSFKEKIFIINVEDVDSSTGDTDHEIKDLIDNNPLPNRISENVIMDVEVGITALAVDKDHDKISYYLIDDADGRFKIHVVDGIVTVADASLIDYEQWQAHSITIKAVSVDGSFISEDFEIKVDDVDSAEGDTDHDVSNLIDDNDIPNMISENVISGDLAFITAKATDLDGDQITYSLLDSDENRFAINTESGVVTVKDASLIDFEKWEFHTIRVQATSSDGSIVEKEFTVDVQNENSDVGDTDHLITGKDIADIDTDSNTISENAAVNDIVHLTANVVDEDGDKVTYELTNNFNGWFQIDENTGVVSVKGNIDYDSTDLTDHKATVSVKATSTDNSTTSKDFEIVITEADGTTPGEGDTDHLITGKDIADIDTDSNTISENAAVNDIVHLTANVVDEDGDKVTYELTKDFNGWFQIDSETGVVTVKGNIDYDSADLTDHKATVSVKATSTDLSNTSKDFEIVIAEADGTTPGGGDTDHLITGKDIADIDTDSNTISENAAVNDIVHLTANVVDEDGDKVTYELTNNFNGWFQIDSETGVVSVKGNIDYDSADLTDHKATVSVKATSTDNSTTSKDFEIVITEADGTTPGGGDTDHLITGKDIADIDTDSNTISENAAINDIVHLTANVVDEDGDKVTYELTNDFHGWFQIDSETGVVSVKSNIDYDFTDLTDHKATVRVKATSTDLSNTSKDFEIVITEADGTTPGEGDTDHLITGKDIADIDSDSNTISENAAINDIVHLTANVIDEDGDKVTYELTNDFHGWFQIDSETGVVSVKSNIDYDSTDLTDHKATVSVKATSTDNSTTSKDFEIVITEADGTTPGEGDTDNPIGPVIDSNSAENKVNENAAIGASTGLTAFATDPDGDDVSYAIDGTVPFSIDPTSGVVRVNGNLDFDTTPSYSVKVIATSTDGSKSNATFIITIENADGTTPGEGDTDHAISEITDNDPATNEVSENANNNDVVGITALAIDPDADVVNYVLIDDAEGRFAIDAITGVITVADETKLDYEQWTSHSVEVKALSTDGSFVTKVFEIAVLDGDGSNPGDGDTDNTVQNLLDINANDNFIYEHTTEGYLVGITANATDLDGDKVVYSLSDDANARFAIDEMSGVVSVNNTSLIDFEKWTSHTITIKATSYDNSILEGDFIIEVLPVNDAPTFVMDTLLQVKEDAGFKFKKGWAKDIKKGPPSERNQEIEFILTNDRNDLFSKQPKIETDGNLSFTPAKDVHGIANIEVVLKDDGGVVEGGTDSSDKKSFKIEILDINDAPSFTKGSNIELGEDAGEQKFNNWASDINVGPDNEGYQTWEFKIENSNTELFSKQPVIDSEGNLSFTIADEKSGLADLVVVMKDDGGLANGGIDISIKQRFSINVADFNDMPIANPDEYSLNEGETLNVNGKGVLGNDSDIDSDHLTAILKDGVEHGELTLEEDGSFVYTHDGSETTSDHFTYTVSDGDKESNTVFVSLIVAAVNDAPLAKDDYGVVNEDEILNGTNLLKNDSDIDSDKLEINTTATVDVAHGELTINENGTYIYTPEANYFGEDSFQYEINDLGSPVQTATATVHLIVNQVKDAPLAYNKSITVFEGSQNNLLEIVEPFDPDGDLLTVQIVHIPKFGEIAINGHAVQVGETISIEDLKQLVYNTKVNTVGDVYFEYQVSDVDASTVLARVNIEVIPEDVFIPQTFTPNGDGENESFTIVGIEDYPNNKIEIFNRWGNAVYTKKRYDNSFVGFGNVKGRISKSKLPSGTYYYVLSLGDGKKPIMGYIYMMY